MMQCRYPQGSQHSARVLADPSLHADPAVPDLGLGWGEGRTLHPVPFRQGLKMLMSPNIILQYIQGFEFSFIRADVKSKYVIVPIKHNEKWIGCND